MILGPVFEQFVSQSPLSVMARATLEHALSSAALDQLFDRSADRGYTKNLLFSTTVDLMSLVVCGGAPHVQAAFQRLRERVPVTLKAVYEKLQHLETAVSTELVRHVGERCQSLVTALGGSCQPLLAGHRVRILDGNHLAGTQKRLQATRGHSAAVLPGQSLAVLDPALMLVTEVVLCEDGHAQERALLDRVLELVAAGDVWVADRNFCTADFLLGLQQRQAFFVIRRHRNLTVEATEAFGPEVETETGWVSERSVRVCRAGACVLQARQIRVRLRQPTADGDEEVEILTNLAATVADAATVALLYLKRWQVEGVFHELTMALHCEVRTLGYPRAALFAFCVAVAAYNVLAVLKAALRVTHGEDKVRQEVSGYYLALEWAAVWTGMMIALPAPLWADFGLMSAHQLAGYLRDWAAKIDLSKIKKAPPRHPTKTKTKRIKDKKPHLSTAHLLQGRERARQ